MWRNKVVEEEGCSLFPQTQAGPASAPVTGFKGAHLDAHSSHPKAHGVLQTLLCMCVRERETGNVLFNRKLSLKAVKDPENLELQSWASFLLEPPLSRHRMSGKSHTSMSFLSSLTFL